MVRTTLSAVPYLLWGTDSTWTLQGFQHLSAPRWLPWAGGQLPSCSVSWDSRNPLSAFGNNSHLFLP